MSEEELRKDILYQIDMQLYDEFNDKLCEMNDNLGTIYTYKDIIDLEEAQKDKERKLLREAINKQQEIVKNQSYTNKKLRNKIKTVRKERNKLQKKLDLKNKIINKMAEKLSTDYHSKEWVIKHFENLIEWGI